jgi:hypothetical protein
MTQLVYSEEELLRSHPFARPQVEAGRRLHGGFDAAGNYVPPRLLLRKPALEAWSQQLHARGGELLHADASLLAGIRYPNTAQMKLLLQEGLGQTLWNTITITGHIEARGRVLADLTFPELQDVIVEDVSEMAIGHLNRGLLRAHGLDGGLRSATWPSGPWSIRSPRFPRTSLVPIRRSPVKRASTAPTCARSTSWETCS